VRTTCTLLLTGILWGLAIAGPAPLAAADESASAGEWPITGKVVETMDSSRYTYVKVDTGTRQVWAAGPATVVKVGDSIHLMSGFPMKDFRSNTLDRTFDVLYLVPAIHIVH